MGNLNSKEIEEVLDWLGSSAMEMLPMLDQLAIMKFHTEFCEKVRPIMIRNTELTKTTFLFKMDNEL